MIYALLSLILYNFEYPIDADNFMMVKCGEEIVRTAGFPLYDSFCWPPLQCKVPWLNNEWLSYVAVYLLHSWGGFLWVTLYKTIIYGLSYGIIFWYVRKKKGALPAACAVIIALYLGRWFVAPRAMMHTALFFPLLAVLLLRLEERGIRRIDFLYFPALFLIWTFFHPGSFIGILFMGMAIALIGAVLIRKDRSREAAGTVLRMVALWALSFAVMFLAPFGARSFSFVVSIFADAFHVTESSHVIPEFSSPLQRVRFNIHYFIITGSALLAFIICAVRYKVKPTPVEQFLFFFWLLASLKAVRNMQLLSTCSIPLFAFFFFHLFRALDGQLQAKKKSTLWSRSRLVPAVLKLAALTAVLATFIPRIAGTDPTGHSLEQGLFPVNLKNFLSGNSLPPDIYCEELAGDYLTYHLAPRYKVSADGRLDLILTRDYLNELYRSYANPDALRSFIEKYGLDTIIMHPRYNFLERDPAWLKIYEGDGLFIYLRKCGRNRELMERFTDDTLIYPDSADTCLFLYVAHIKMKHYETARKYLVRLIISDPKEQVLRDQLKLLDKKIKKEKS
ncbi:MAG: hypothetical protein RDV48_02345 [Candidatus Eremiobacteraeota bacterium]|nr:hypothetical protein [Candidatus Eremiobacteraeota bacterium]